MKKSDVALHSDRGAGMPAINVKVYRLPWDNDTITEHFRCSLACAAKAAEFSFNSAQRQFWVGIQDTAREILGAAVEVHFGGRSGGWLEVHNLPDLESWDAVALAKWAKFEKATHAEVAYLTAWEYHLEAIKANRWTEEGAEAYNFYEKADRSSGCLSELKQQAIAAGYGLVVR